MTVQTGTVALANTAKPNDRWKEPAIRWEDGLVTYGSVACQPDSPIARTFAADKRSTSGLCATGSHLACPGLIAQPRGRNRVQVALCGCDCGHGLASLVHDRIVLGGYRCTKCSTRKPLLDRVNAAGPLDHQLDSIDPRIDPRTGACVDREQCGTLVAHKLDTSPLRTGRTTMPRQRTTDADGETTAAAPRTARVKEGKCEHCGVKTNGGKFAPGHDAQLKSTLATTAQDRTIPEADRVDALAEQIARGWLKVRSAHDQRKLMKGVKAGDEDAELRAKIETEWNGLLTQADKKVLDEGVEGLLGRRVTARTS